MEGFFNHLNPAIIRNVMLKMNEKEFAECEKFIRKQALNLPVGRKREMYVQLVGWCRSIAEQRSKNKPSLF